jgi:hypothetical protein
MAYYVRKHIFLGPAAQSNEYIVNPENIVFNSDGIINVLAEGYGNTVSATGNRFYDLAVLPNGPLSGLAGDTVRLPFDNTFADLSYGYNAICTVTIESTKYVYGASYNFYNSTFSEPVSDVEIFWLDLVSYKSGSGNSGNFMAYTKPVSFLGNDEVRVNFLNPTPTTETFVVETSLLKTTGELLGTTTRNILIPSGTTSFVVNPAGYLNAAFVRPPGLQGYFRTSISCSNSSYRSLLEFYNFGVDWV